MSNVPPPSVADNGLRGRHPLDADYYGSEGTSEPRGYLAGTGSLSVSGVSPAMAGEEQSDGRYASPMAREEGTATPQSYASQAPQESNYSALEQAALPTTSSAGGPAPSDSPVFAGNDFADFQLAELPIQENNFAPADYVDNSSVITGGNTEITTTNGGGGGGGSGEGGNTYNITTNIENNFTATQEVSITLRAGDRVDARVYNDNRSVDDHSIDDHSHHDDHSIHLDGHDGHDGHDHHTHHEQHHHGHPHGHPHPPQPPRDEDCQDRPHFPLPGWDGLSTPGPATGEPEVHAQLGTGIDGIDPELTLNTGLINHRVIDLSATTSTLTRAVQQTLGLAMPIIPSLADGVRSGVGLQLAQLAPAAGGQEGQELHLSARNLAGPLSPELDLHSGLIGHPLLDIMLPNGHGAQIGSILPETLETVGSAFGSGQTLPFAADHLHGLASSLNDTASRGVDDIGSTLAGVGGAASNGSLLGHVLAGDIAGGDIDGIVHGIGDSLTDSALRLGDPGSEIAGLRDVQNDLGGAVHHLADGLGHLAGDLVGGLSGALGSVHAGLSDLGAHLGGTHGVGGLVNGALAITSHAAGQLNDGVSGTVGDIVSGVGGVIGGVGHVIAHPADAVSGAVDTVGAHANNALGGIVGTVGQVNDAVGGAVSSVGGTLSGAVHHATSGGVTLPTLGHHSSAFASESSHGSSVHGNSSQESGPNVFDHSLGALDDGLGHLSASFDSAADHGLSALALDHGAGSGDAASLLDLHLDHATSGLDLSAVGHESVLDLQTLLADGSHSAGFDPSSIGHEATDPSSLGDPLDHAASSAVSSVSHAIAHLPVHHGA